MKQQGASVTVMVISLSAIALIIMVSLEQQLAEQITLHHHEHHYLAQYNQAYSALNWGLYQPWPTPTLTWFCQSNSQNRWRSCMKLSENFPELVIVSGKGELPSSLSLYRLAHPQPSNEEANTYLTPISSGWFDLNVY